MARRNRKRSRRKQNKKNQIYTSKTTALNITIEEKQEEIPEKSQEEISKSIHDNIMKYSDSNDDVNKVSAPKTLEQKIHESIHNFDKSVNKVVVETKKDIDSILEEKKSDYSVLEYDDTSKTKEVEKVQEIKESKEIAKIPIEETPEYVSEMLNKKKRRRIIISTTAVLVVFISLFSTIFAFSNQDNDKILDNISIKNIDIEKKDFEEAKNILKEKLDMELSKDMTLLHGEYSIAFNPSVIGFVYDIDDAVQRAYGVGRDGNIVQNNYSIIKTKLIGNKFDISYSYDEALFDKYIDDMSPKIPGIVIEPSYYIEDSKLIVEKGSDGIRVKRDELKKKIINAILSRTYENVQKDGFAETLEIPTENAKASNIDMDKIYAEIHTEPKDASYTLEPYALYPDEDGVDLKISVEEAKKQVLAQDKQEYTFDLNITKASKTVKDLGTEAFPYQVSTFSTKYDASNINRSTNLEIAARKINGTVLMPGEVFSYNKVVGKRTVEEGYKDAKIYADGGVVDGLAGGICQISSTLYNAAVMANLEIVERRNHSYPTSYLPAGKDATVVYGVLDLKFKNTRKYPIKITSSVKNGVASFTVHGIKEENEYEVTLLPVTTATIPHGTQTIPDPSLPAGQQVVKQSGHAGYRVTTYIQKTCNGQTTKEVFTNDTYQPMATIIRVGTGAPAAAPMPPQ